MGRTSFFKRLTTRRCHARLACLLEGILLTQGGKMEITRLSLTIFALSLMYIAESREYFKTLTNSAAFIKTDSQLTGEANCPLLCDVLGDNCHGFVYHDLLCDLGVTDPSDDSGVPMNVWLLHGNVKYQSSFTKHSSSENYFSCRPAALSEWLHLSRPLLPTVLHQELAPLHVRGGQYALPAGRCEAVGSENNRGGRPHPEPRPH